MNNKYIEDSLFKRFSIANAPNLMDRTNIYMYIFYIITSVIAPLPAIHV